MSTSATELFPSQYLLLKEFTRKKTAQQPSIPPDIVTEMEQIRAQYCDLSSPLAIPLAEASYSFLASEVPAIEIS